MPPLPEPTDAEPGTPEKIEIMAARYAAGLAIRHPADNLSYTDRRENNSARLLIGGVRETNHRGVRWDRQPGRHYRRKSTGGYE